MGINRNSVQKKVVSPVLLEFLSWKKQLSQSKNSDKHGAQERDQPFLKLWVVPTQMCRMFHKSGADCVHKYVEI